MNDRNLYTTNYFTPLQCTNRILVVETDVYYFTDVSCAF